MDIFIEGNVPAWRRNAGEGFAGRGKLVVIRFSRLFKLTLCLGILVSLIHKKRQYAKNSY